MHLFTPTLAVAILLGPAYALIPVDERTVPDALETCRVDSRRDKSEAKDNEYDFIVVGAGTTGSVVASELASANGCAYSVLVVESGVDLTRTLNHVVPNRVLDAMTDRDSLRRYTTVLQGPTAPMSLGHQTVALQNKNYYSRAHTVGGSNAHHAMQTWVPTPAMAAAWVAAAEGTASPDGADRWSHANLVAAINAGVAGNFTNFESSDREFPLQQMLLEAAEEFFDSNPHLVAANGTRQRGTRGNAAISAFLNSAQSATDPALYLGAFASNPSQTKKGERAWPGTEFMRRAKNESCGPLGAGTHPHFLKRILFDDIPESLSRRATGVEFFTSPNAYAASGLDQEYTDFDGVPFNTSETQTAYARFGVVLSMGPFETPKFLQLAGIGPPAELGAFNIATRVGLAGVGKTLVDDIEVSLIYSASVPVPLAYQHSANRDPEAYGALWYSPFIQDGVKVEACSKSTANSTVQDVCPGLDCVDDLSLCAHNNSSTNPLGNPTSYCIPCACFRASTWEQKGVDPCGTGLSFALPDEMVVQDDAMAEWLYSRTGTHAFAPVGEMPFLTYKSGGGSDEYGDCYVLMTPVVFPNQETTRLTGIPFPGDPRTPFPFTLDVLTDGAVQLGTVSLASADPRSSPLIDPRYFSDASGTDRTARCIMHARRFATVLSDTHKTRTGGIIGLSEEPYFAAPSLVAGNPEAAAAPPVSARSEAQDPDLWAAELAATIEFAKERAFSHHPVGGNRMGPASDPLAVVDGRLRVRGTQNLFVVDMSIVPKAVPHFPSATAVGVGIIGAKLLVQAAESAHPCDGTADVKAPRQSPSSDVGWIVVAVASLVTIGLFLLGGILCLPVNCCWNKMCRSSRNCSDPARKPSARGRGKYGKVSFY